MNDKYETQMKKGVLDMLVLKLLAAEPKYGYQIINELREKSKERFLLKEGTLYPILYRLEDDGLVTSTWSEAEESASRKKLPRKYYAITESGLKALEEIAALWEEISSSVRLILSEEEL